MFQIQETAVQSLTLDLKNYRTVPQKDEISAVKAMASINPDYFWGLTESLLDSGYLPTENIIILKSLSGKPSLIVKEGNRRVAALKLIHGYIKKDNLNMPTHIFNAIDNISTQWVSDNSKIPCKIYENSEAATVDRIVSLTHGKGERASRDKWESVATARHNRDANNVSEPALDLLEKYLDKGQNITPQQSERWAGHYPLSILAEVMKRLAIRLNATNAPDLATKYPSNISHLNNFETILNNIGLGRVTFPIVRSTTPEFGMSYGIPQLQNPVKGNTVSSTSGTNQASQSTTSQTTNNNSTSAGQNTSTSTPAQNNSNTPGANQPTGTGTTASSNGSANNPAYAINDPRAVTKILKQFNPNGPDRQKVVTLKEEALSLNLKKNPIAFCFLLRSMFEISAKAYCNQHNLPFVKKDGKDKNGNDKFKDKTLVELLTDITNHLHGNKSNTAMLKQLHGPLTEISRQDGILSVTSMNHLVHNPKFSVSPSDICTLFGNIYPLLEYMN